MSDYESLRRKAQAINRADIPRTEIHQIPAQQRGTELARKMYHRFYGKNP